MDRVIYIASRCNSVKRASSVLPSLLQSSGQRWCLCCARTLCSHSLLLSLTIVCGRQHRWAGSPVPEIQGLTVTHYIVLYLYACHINQSETMPTAAVLFRARKVCYLYLHALINLFLLVEIMYSHYVVSNLIISESIQAFTPPLYTLV